MIEMQKTQRDEWIRLEKKYYYFPLKPRPKMTTIQFTALWICKLKRFLCTFWEVLSTLVLYQTQGLSNVQCVSLISFHFNVSTRKKKLSFFYSLKVVRLALFTNSVLGYFIWKDRLQQGPVQFYLSHEKKREPIPLQSCVLAARFSGKDM